MRCGRCLECCPSGALVLSEDELVIDRRRCEACFDCADVCPAGAMIRKGEEAEAAELCRELLKDRAYFGDDGGVTLSGGEALMQGDAVELLRLLQAAGVQTAVDTCGMLFAEQFTAALPHIDVLLYDLKLADDDAHRRFTGQGNALILMNFRSLGEWITQGGRLWVRTPIIPGATDTDENIRAIGEIIRQTGYVERWELCAFNNLCTDKYEQLGIRWRFAGTPLLTKARLKELEQIAQSTNACANIRATGATKQEESHEV